MGKRTRLHQTDEETNERIRTLEVIYFRHLFLSEASEAKDFTTVTVHVKRTKRVGERLIECKYI